MSDSTSYKNTSPEQGDATAAPRRHFPKALKILLWSLASIVLLIVLAAVGATLYLSPERTAKIINKEASAYLKADVRIADVNWTLWSSFPWLKVDIDSIGIRSRTLDNLPGSLQKSIPADASHLASTGRIKGGINVWKALKGDIMLKGIEVDRPDINLVSVNDSVANFLIFPSMKKDMEMPDITLDTIRIGQPIRLSYLSISGDAEVKADIDRLEFHGQPEEANVLDFLLGGNLRGRVGEFSSGASLPVGVQGKISLLDKGKKVDIRNLDIHVADIKGALAGIVDLKETPSIYPLKFSLDAPDLMQLLPFVPDNMLPSQLKNLKAFIPLKANVELLAPYIPSKKGVLPALVASVASDGGSLSYPLSQKQTLNLEGLGIEAEATVDPSDPERSHINLTDLRMETDGTSLHVTGAATRLLTKDPDIRLDLQCAADLNKAITKILPSSGMTVSGDLTGKSSLSCQLSDLSKKQLKNLKLDGDFQVAALALSDAASSLCAKLSDFSLNIGADMPQVNTSSLTDGKFDLLTYVGNANVKAQGIDATLHNTSLKGNFGAKGSLSSPVAAGTINLSSALLALGSDSAAFSSEGVKVNLNGSLRQIPFSPSNYYPSNPTSRADSAVAAKFRHTPLYLVPSVSPMLQSVLSLLNLKASVSVDKGKIETPAYPAENLFTDLRLQTNLDTLRISSLRLKTRGASGFISGKVEGLRSFLSSSSPVPLKATLTANLDDVDINRLSGTYFRGVENITGKTPQLLPPPLGPYTAADSLCVALPRNLSIDATLSSGSAEYMQYSFSPLSTRIIMDGGTATLKGLSIGTPFCANSIDWTYSTSNLDSISMAIKADVDNFDFTKFCTAFPEVAVSAPQLKNLSADVSLHAAGNFVMNPDMFVEAPSMEGDVTLGVRDLSFIRDKKALKYTHLMLIRGDGPVKIDSLDIHAAFHDNLLQLDPFTIDGGGYKLLIGGVNNLRGQMYYHIGLLHNPLHLPFGVNIVGYYRKPEIRFGGRWIKDGRERKIAADLGSDVHVNIMRNLSHGWLLFVGNAAKYDFKNNSGEGLNVR